MKPSEFLGLKKWATNDFMINHKSSIINLDKRFIDKEELKKKMQKLEDKSQSTFSYGKPYMYVDRKYFLKIMKLLDTLGGEDGI